jgi:hypothetical protein
MFTARYALSPYIKQARFVFKMLRNSDKILFKTPVLLSSASLATTADTDTCLYRVDLCLLSSFGFANLTYTT